MYLKHFPDIGQRVAQSSIYLKRKKKNKELGLSITFAAKESSRLQHLVWKGVPKQSWQSPWVGGR